MESRKYQVQRGIFMHTHEICLTRWTILWVWRFWWFSWSIAPIRSNPAWRAAGGPLVCDWRNRKEAVIDESCKGGCMYAVRFRLGVTWAINDELAVIGVWFKRMVSVMGDRFCMDAWRLQLDFTCPARRFLCVVGDWNRRFGRNPEPVVGISSLC